MKTSLPIAGEMVELELPDEHAACLAQHIVATGVAYARFDKAISSPRLWAAAIINQHRRAEALGTLDSEHERMRKHVRGYRRHRATYPQLSVGDLCNLFRAGETPWASYKDVMGAERIRLAGNALAAVVGHPLVHRDRPCNTCEYILEPVPDWTSLLFKQGVPAEAIDELYEGLRAARIVPSIEDEARRWALSEYDF